jgi:hypothetical protein
MSLLNQNKKKDKKKGSPSASKQSLIPNSGKSNSKSAAKSTRMTNRAQRGA